MLRWMSVSISAVVLGVVLGSVTPAYAAPFAAGDLVVYRVGSGSGSLVNTGSPVYLDEYSPTGTLVQSIAMPTTVSGLNKPLIASGTATSEGFLSRSTDGRYILLTGYGTTLGGTTSLAGTTAAAVNRVVGRVDSSGTVDTTTALTDFADTNNPRGATSTNGTDLWIGGASGGVRYTTLGATTSTQLSTAATNIRQVAIVGGQLYVSTSSSSFYVAAVGSGTPETSGQTMTALSPLTGVTSPDAFVLLDTDATPGVDTLYVADDKNSGGIFKYCLVGGVWTAEGSKGNGSNTYSGLTGSWDGSSVTLFTTRKGGSGASGGGELASIVDTSGFGATMNGSFTLLATAATNEAFRGVALAPVPEPCTLALLAAGGALALGRRYRRRQ